MFFHGKKTILTLNGKPFKIFSENMRVMTIDNFIRHSEEYFREQSEPYTELELPMRYSESDCEVEIIEEDSPLNISFREDSAEN